MSLLEKYETQVALGVLKRDEEQIALVAHFQTILDTLHKHSTWFGRLWHRQARGLYLYGPVGCGKTYLMDLFYQEVTGINKARFHFHHFMQQVDAKLRQLQGQTDPVRQIAISIARKTKLICLDEFLVQDVAHAMMLRELLQTLFKHGVILVTTANTKPDDLYHNGVYRERFIPAIQLIKQCCSVVCLQHASDYRIGRPREPQAYLYPCDPRHTHLFQQQFDDIAMRKINHQRLMIQQRPIQTVAVFEGIVWFEFAVICQMPRCQLDYLELADRFHTVFLSHLPSLSADDTAPVILLIHLIDVLYDRGIRLFILADVAIEQIYSTGPMLKEFQRTQSRLQEMQSRDYMSRHTVWETAAF